MTPPVTEEAPEVVYTDEHPEFPKLLYNHETRATKSAANKEAQDKLAEEGFVEDVFPADDPTKLTEAEIAQLRALVDSAKDAAAALAKLSKPEEEPAAPTI